MTLVANWFKMKSRTKTLTSCTLCIVIPYSPLFCFIVYEATPLASFEAAFFYNGEKTIFFTLYKLGNFL